MTPGEMSALAVNLPFRTSRDEAPAFWMYDILWVPLVEGHQTGGSFSVIEQWMRKGSGALVPHVHHFSDEWFYILEGGLTFTVDGRTVTGSPGDSIWVARGTVHNFVVTSEMCHVLNGYTPAGFEQVIKHLASPAERRELPPADMPKPDDRTITLIYNNFWSAEAGLGWARTRDDPRSGRRVDGV
ncbi:MAG: cupin domain-containing protein [Methylobacteriaceae bacterium]|nr:cupin domain-containing protein [Methylobacteriaceae bacterium]